MIYSKTYRQVAGLLVLGLLLAIAGCRGAEEHPSKSGRYIVSAVFEEDNQGRWLRFQVRERAGKVLFVSPERWAAPHNTEYAFDDADRVWLYSSDVGTSVWAHVDGDKWQKMKREEWQGLPEPASIKSAEP